MLPRQITHPATESLDFLTRDQELQYETLAALTENCVYVEKLTPTPDPAESASLCSKRMISQCVEDAHTAGKSLVIMVDDGPLGVSFPLSTITVTILSSARGS